MIGELRAQVLAVITERTRDRVSTLGELAALAEEIKLPLSQVVVGEAMAKENKSYTRGYLGLFDR